MSEIIKNYSFCPVISEKQALMINNANDYLGRVQSEATQLMLKAEQQAQNLEELAKINSYALMETKSIELHNLVCMQINKLLEKLTDNIGEVISTICNKQKLEIPSKDSLKELINQDLRQYLDFDHVELTANSLATTDLQDLLKRLFPQRNFIFRINNDLADYQCNIETPFSTIYIDFKTGKEQLLSVLKDCS